MKRGRLSPSSLLHIGHYMGAYYHRGGDRMRRFQQYKNRFGQWWRRISWSSFFRFAGVAVAALIVGISAGVYFDLPVMDSAPSIVPPYLEEEVLAAVVRDQVHRVLEESYPWVLEEPIVPAVVEPPAPPMPTPDEPRPEAKEAVSFDHLIWPAKGEITTPFGWYRHPVYNDWRFNSGVELSVEDDQVRTVLPGKVISVTSSDLETELVIDHGGGWQSRYRSIEGLTVVPGQEVKQNQTIGRAADGVVYFGLLHDGEPVNPQAFLR